MGHVPRAMSKVTSFFLGYDGNIEFCEVTGERLEPCSLVVRKLFADHWLHTMYACGCYTRRCIITVCFVWDGDKWLYYALMQVTALAIK